MTSTSGPTKREAVWFTLSSQGGPKDNYQVTAIQHHRRNYSDDLVRPNRVRGERIIQFAGLGYAISQAGDRLMWAAEHNNAQDVERIVLPRCRGKVLFRTRLASVGSFLITIILFFGLSYLHGNDDASWTFAVLSLVAVFSLIFTILLGAANFTPWIGEPGPSVNFYINGEFTSVLHVACAFGSIDVIKILLSNGSDPNVSDLRLRTPLHYAALHGHMKICALLIQSGASIDVRDDHDMYPYDLARQSSEIDSDEINEILQGPSLLLLHAIRECFENNEDEAPKEVRSILSSSTEFLSNSAWSSNVRDMEVSMVDVIDENDDTEEESDSDQEEMTGVGNKWKKPIASSKSKDENTRIRPKGTWGMTPLMLIGRDTTFSFYLMEWEMIVRDLIIEHGAYVDSLHPTNGKTALQYSIQSGNRALAIVFLNFGADPLRVDYIKGRTSLHDACSKKGNLEIVKLMLMKITGRDLSNNIEKEKDENDNDENDNKNDNDNDKKNDNKNEQETSLNAISSTNSDNDIDPFDNDGTTPLHLSIVRSDVQIVQLLLKYGANPLLTSNNGMSKLGSMHTPFGWLASKGTAVHLEMMRAIAASCATSHGTLNETSDETSKTTSGATADIITSDIKTDTCCSSLKINARDPCGLTPLHLASRSGRNNIVRFILDEFYSTVDVDVLCSKSYKTSKEYAVANGHTETVALLDRFQKKKDTKVEEEIGDQNGMRARKKT